MAKACPTPQPLRLVLGTIVFITVLFLIVFLGRLMFSPLMPAIVEDPSVQTRRRARPARCSSSVRSDPSRARSWLGFVSSRIKHRGISARDPSSLIALTLVGAYFANSVWALRAVFIVLGMCAGLHLPSSMATLTATVRREDWGKALSIQQLGPPVSSRGGPPTGRLLLNWFSWNEALLWIAGLTAVLGLAFLLFTPGVGNFPGDPPNPSLVKPVLAHAVVLGDDLHVRAGAWARRSASTPCCRST